MATWVEFRCEYRGTSKYNKGECWSDSNAGPMGMADDTNADILNVLTGLRAEAKKSGWVRLASGWICPECDANRRAARLPGTNGSGVGDHG